jgi:hypothetical protein
MFAPSFVAVLATAFIMPSSCEQLSVPVLFLFEQSRGLQAKSPVVYRDMAVGQVTAVEPGEDGKVYVQAYVSSSMFQQMNRPCTAFIRRNKYRYYKTAKCVVIYLDEEAEPLAEAITKVEGCDSWPELLLWQGSHMAKTFMSDHQEEMDAIKQAARDASQWVEEFAESEETQEFVAKLNALADETGEKARELYRELRKRWPIVAKQLEEVCTRLEELGRSEEAQRLRESMRKLFSRLFSPTPEPEEEAGKQI